jgi:hypothetical protein
MIAEMTDGTTDGMTAEMTGVMMIGETTAGMINVMMIGETTAGMTAMTEEMIDVTTAETTAMTEEMIDGMIGFLRLPKMRAVKSISIKKKKRNWRTLSFKNAFLNYYSCP